MLRSIALPLACAFVLIAHAQQMICSATVETVAQHKGEKVVFCGTPAEVYVTKKANGPVFLRFGDNYPDAYFTVVIFSEVACADREALATRLKGHALRVRGLVKPYKGRPEIILKRMADLEVE